MLLLSTKPKVLRQGQTQLQLVLLAKRGAHGTPAHAVPPASLPQVSHHLSPLPAPLPWQLPVICLLEGHQLPGRCWWPQDPPFSP